MKDMIPKKAGDGITRRNLPAEERRRELLNAALDLFSQKGQSITVQELADRVNVTQPLVHRYFPAKADLIAAIRDTLHNAHWDPQWQEILTEGNRDLGERIKAFYAAYLPHVYNDRWYRGFWYATLEDPSFAQAYVDHVHDELLVSIANEARRAFGFASIEDVPVFEREMELIWGLHSTVIFVGIRLYVYHTPVSNDLAAIIGDQVRAYLAVAPIVLSELMPS
ncbi:TetR/AcrR family transcriptional regulator [Rhizobium sp. KVB221]|uniref:TetR/AcrR family transcriptional regulator n=1 Tax=Rhizobium setariae TaxID=2801340 RepID=A0A937CP80_9HYPH|nr:TetR/AcrR family transcriptional regulator [Rhizobium setariae]MBL0372128.1 TetR/AcrR family transcriptional regulator [Rhizobium setariae]